MSSKSMLSPGVTPGELSATPPARRRGRRSRGVRVRRASPCDRAAREALAGVRRGGGEREGDLGGDLGRHVGEVDEEQLLAVLSCGGVNNRSCAVAVVVVARGGGRGVQCFDVGEDAGGERVGVVDRDGDGDEGVCEEDQEGFCEEPDVLCGEEQGFLYEPDAR